ncbi:universal stress protein [Caenispirillum salinarum]|uniref:universal stress protein n=1 Tax=Caenispirillum salinarum TaxID=859058 RepID=UPI00384EC5A5
MYFKNLLVAVDGSDHAMKALELAVQLEDKFDSNLHILSVYRHYGMFESSHSLVRPRQELAGPDEALRQIAQEIVDMAAKRAEELGATGIKKIVKRGKAARTILEYSKDKGIDCIVMGKRGIGDGGGGLLGSTSNRVATLASCTCITVK